MNMTLVQSLYKFQYLKVCKKKNNENNDLGICIKKQ